MDSDPTNTKNHAIDKLLQCANILTIKHVPGKLASHLANTVVIPRIAYLLQVTPLTQTDLNKIDTILRKITKKKMNLPLSTPTSILQDKNFHIKLNSFEFIIDCQNITNLQIAQSYYKRNR